MCLFLTYFGVLQCPLTEKRLTEYDPGLIFVTYEDFVDLLYQLRSEKCKGQIDHKWQYKATIMGEARFL
ncbi:hypothetical protein KDI_40830 [Dictyobacter arantiisoli]|uniref:Uncharacterized protein n=1 Tax=Dictyobacter arantiisoli TaxID=2014874 RepID=A0A5A5THL3_9CHLR|nr:hypothetical protein KDI_40830 [Dictyobacter arantiisoli]